MGRTTLARDLIDMIRVGQAKKEDILRDLESAADNAATFRAGTPTLKVQFHVMRETVAAKATPHLAHGTGGLGSPAIINRRDQPAPSYDLAMEVPMYEMSDVNRVDVIRFGRHPDQDVQLLDQTVSREHGLIIFSGKRLPLFCDYGTLIDGKHAGSMNGTYLEGTLIKDSMVDWLPNQTLNLVMTRSGDWRFKINYEFVLSSGSGR